MHGVPGSCRLLLLHFILVLCCLGMATEGLPMYRQEHGGTKDVLSGKEFVEILLDSPAQQDLVEIRTPATESGKLGSDTNTRIRPELVRQTRSSIYSGFYPKTSPPDVEEATLKATEVSTMRDHFSSKAPKGDKVVVLAVSVSTSTGDSQRIGLKKSETNRNNVNSVEGKAVIQSEYRPSIIAESNRNDFSVEEGEPVVTNQKTQSTEDEKEYPARVQPVPSPQALPLINANSDFYQEFARDEDKDLSPYHHQTLIFHDNPHEPEKARSVSYTSVIHTLPQDKSKQWEDQLDTKKSDHDRQERHYDTDTNFRGNNFYTEENEKDPQESDSPKPSKGSPTEGFDYNNKKTWEDQQDSVETSTRQTQWTTTKIYEKENNSNGDTQNMKPLTYNHQRIYGQPEQNYEIEESVSVLTNGRAHGVQPIPGAKSTSPSAEDSTTSKSTSVKPGDNQKVGYVVEGRNYRKYRVEERTPDGFIVGEYGVVSHNDGTLRGVRYTADGTINPRLIYDALMKFLSL